MLMQINLVLGNQILQSIQFADYLFYVKNF